MLSRYLQQANCQVYHSTADADLLIVNKAVESSRTMDTVLVGDDTDLLILLCHHAELDAFGLFFQPEPRANSTKRRSWNVKSVKEKLRQEICRHILFIQAVSYIVDNWQRSSTKELLSATPTFVNTSRYLTVFQCQRKKLLMLVSNSLFVFTIGSLKKDLMDWD